MAAAAAAMAANPTISAASISSNSSISPRISLLIVSSSKLPKTSSTRIRCQQAQQAAAPIIPREQRWMFEESEINGPDIWNKTWYPKASDHVTTEKTWYVVDATDKILGRLASTIAIHIRGKNLATYTPSVDMGAYVIVVNAEKVAVSGKKRTQKLYRRHSGRPGGMKVETFDQLQQRIPERIIEHAVRGMLPKGREETRIKLQAGTCGPPEVKSALTVVNSGGTGLKGDPRQCYNCWEVGHLRYACTKPPKKGDSGGGHGQFRGRSRGRGGRRGGRGGHRANLLVAEGEHGADGAYTEEDQVLLNMLDVLKRKKVSSDGTEETSTAFLIRGNYAIYVHPSEGTDDSLAFASMTSRRSLDWIVDSGASRHVTENASKFSSYTQLASADVIQTADGIFQPVVGEKDGTKTWDWHLTWWTVVPGSGRTRFGIGVCGREGRNGWT